MVDVLCTSGDGMIKICDIKNLVELDIDAGMRCGVYFLCKGDEVVYVGQSTNVIQRVASHMAEVSNPKIDPTAPIMRKKFDRAFFLKCETGDLDRLEGAFIRIFEPKANGRGPKVRDSGSTIISILAGAKVA